MSELLKKAVSAIHKGDSGKAKKMLETFLRQEPENKNGLYFMGSVLLGEGKIDLALVYLTKAVAGDDTEPCWYVNYAKALERKGNYDAAEKAFRLAEVSGCQIPQFYHLYGLFLTQIKKDYKKAEICYAKIIERYPKDVNAYISLGNVYHAQAKYDDVIQVLEYCLSQNGENASIYINLGLALSEQGRCEAAVEAYEKAIELDPSNDFAISNRIMNLLNVHDDQAYLYSEIRKMAEKLNTNATLIYKGEVNKDPEKKLKLGFISADLNRHAISNYITPVLAKIDKSQFVICMYYNNIVVDDMTNIIRSMADQWCNCAHLSTDDLVQQIRKDNIDILVDLSNHTKGNRFDIFVKKSAPIQISYMGLPVSTGLDSIDYSFFDQHMIDTCNLEQNASEKVIPLPWNHYYMQTSPLPDLSPPPCLENGFITFGSFNGLRKITSNIIEVWAQILARIPDSKIRMVIIDEKNKDMQNYIYDLFEKHNISRDRVKLVGKVHVNLYLLSHNEVDIALDPYPYNGVTTTYYTLMMGVPLVSCSGKSIASNNGYGILSKVSKQHWVGKNLDEYIDIAVGLAEDPNYLIENRKTLRKEMQNSKLMAHDAYVRNLEKALRNIWQDYCLLQDE